MGEISMFYTLEIDTLMMINQEVKLSFFSQLPSDWDFGERGNKSKIGRRIYAIGKKDASE